MSDTPDLIDLDAVVAPDLRVKLNGTVYRLPGDAPTEQLLRLQVLANRLDRESDGKNPEELLEMREELSAEIADLFRIREPDLDDEGLDLSDAQAVELMRRLFEAYYPGGDGEDEEGGARPTPARTRPKRKSAPRSRASSGSRARKPSASSTSSQT